MQTPAKEQFRFRRPMLYPVELRVLCVLAQCFTRIKIAHFLAITTRKSNPKMCDMPSKPTTLTRVAECLYKNDHGTYFALLKVRGKQIKKIPQDEGRSRSEATPGAPPSEGPKSTL